MYDFYIDERKDEDSPLTALAKVGIRMKNQTLTEYLNEMVREVFDDLTLVIVDEKKGYMPISVEKIFCYRSYKISVKNITHFNNFFVCFNFRIYFLDLIGLVI